MLSRETALWAQGYRRIGGVDEVGAGAFYGPLLAACVVLVEGRVPAGLTDSKALSPRRREQLYAEICAQAAGVAIGEASVAEVDALGPREASRLAMKRAVEALGDQVDYLLVDYHRLDVPIPHDAFPRADATSACVAAASIVAKVTRDRLIRELAAAEDPAYDLARNMGYGSPRHREALCRLGPTPMHRRSYLRRTLAGTPWADEH